jgi:predicted lipid-binding transport protein (Tim44 family)
VNQEALQTTRVAAVVKLEVETYLEINVGETSLFITPEHPVMVSPGEFRTAGLIRPGDRVIMARGGELQGETVSSVRRVDADRPAYNLLVHPGGTFLPGGIAVHNKGCFLPDNLILLADGRDVPISTVRPGDLLLAFTSEGAIVRTRVHHVLRLEATEHVVLKTDRQTLFVTADHPFFVGEGAFKTLDALRVGDRVIAWDGQSLTVQQIVSMETVSGRTPVYNLQTEYPHTFFVGHVAVHNKGGGGGGGGGSFGSSHSGSSRGGGTSSDDPMEGLIVILIILTFLVIMVIVKRRARRSKSENLDFLYSPSVVARKADRTEKLFQFLSRQDPSMAPSDVRKYAESTVRKLQECWEKRDYGPMEPLMMPSLYAQHTTQLRAMVRNHEINRIEDFRVDRVDLVNVRYTEKPNQREFTALISASARDYYVEDPSGKFLRGDKAAARFQEFLTFQRLDNRWLLREIEQAGESDYLKDENFVEMLTDQNLQGIYAEAAGREGEAGPWLERGVEEKATRIERMLNFLAQTDKLWNRQQMQERTRQVFLRVYLAREAGDPGQTPAEDLFPAAADSLRDQLRQWQMDDIKVEYRNLCVRKVEIVLVRNFTERSRDEFTVRVSAHAQKIVRKGGLAQHEDRYVTPFEDYWTFGRLDEQWKLKEVLPPMEGKKRMAEENVDEDSSAGQLQWYYRQTRAN